MNSGESVSAVCNINLGDSPLEIHWTLNDIPIGKDYLQIIMATSKRNSLLTIDSVSPDHAGDYKCIVSNKAGATSYMSKLIVNGTYANEIFALLAATFFKSCFIPPIVYVVVFFQNCE